MLRALWFAVKVGLLVAASVWVANRPGFVEAHWLGYDVRAHVGLALLLLLLVLVLTVFVYRILWGVVTMPKALRRYRQERSREKGFRALTLGLTAVAAGDAKQAEQQAERARRFLPSDRGLSLLLEAQAARLRGEDAAAQEIFARLLENRDTAFLGLRGLLVNALEDRNSARALELARRARLMHPRQPWVLRVTYELELRHRNWDEARRILDSAVASGAVDREQARRDGVAIALQQAEDALHAGQDGLAHSRLRQAHKADPGFVPAAARLARYYTDKRKHRAAAAAVEQAWKAGPHPDLAAAWRDAMPRKALGDPAARLRWFERLVALRPDSADGQMAAAEEALEQGLWGTARQYLERAQELQPSPRLYRLRARLAQAQEKPEEANLMLRKAAEAPQGRAWVCRETGRVYDHWSPVAQPHGSFNTIAWDFPQARARDSAVNDRTELLITAPAERA